MRRTLFIILAISFFLGGCTLESIEDFDSEVEKLNYLITQPGTVALPLTKYNTLNPLINDNISYYYLSKLIFEGLFDFDENLQATPKLAESYEIDSQGKVYIKLREDIYWHDGEKLTTSDIKFTIDALRLGSDNVYSHLINSTISSNRILSVNIIDEYKLEINFEKLSPNILGLLTFPILPEHGFDYVRMALREDFIPIGTGPFKFSNTSRSKDIELIANENYRFGKPRINKIIGRVLDDDLSITSFEAGQIDITITSDVEWDKYKQTSSNVIEFISSEYEFLGFNFNNKIFSDVNGNAIRKAMAYGINIQNIIENIYRGHGSQVDIPIHPNSWHLLENIDTYGYDPLRSKEYLYRAGFDILDEDGVLMDADGNRLEFRYLTNSSNILRRKTAELIKEDLNNIGIEIIFDNSYTGPEYSSEVKDMEWTGINEKIAQSDFDIIQLGLSMSVIPDVGQLFHTEGMNNFINYSNEEMDSLILNYESNNLDNIIKNNLQKHVVDELPYVSLFYKNKAILINSKIIGELNPTYYNPYNGLENCFTTVKGH